MNSYMYLLSVINVELNNLTSLQYMYSKTPLSKRPKVGFQDQFSLMQVKIISECSPWNILQYIRPSLSYHLSLRILFCLCLSGRFTQVLLYSIDTYT